MKLLYFAWVRQKVGLAEETFAPPPTVKTVGDLIDALRTRGQGYAAAFDDVKRIRCAVNQNHVGLDASVAPGDEIAFFPPVTGG